MGEAYRLGNMISHPRCPWAGSADSSIQKVLEWYGIAMYAVLGARDVACTVRWDELYDLARPFNVPLPLLVG
jgi:hypothetical protein